MKTIESIKSQREEWANIVSQKAIQKCDQLNELLIKAKEEQENFELQKKRDTRISEKKVEEFKVNVMKNIKSSAGLRNILGFYRLIKFKPETILTGNDKKLGINTFFDKSAFFADDVEPHIHFLSINNGFDFGRSIIQGENKAMINEINELVDIIDEIDFKDYLENVTDISKFIFISINNAIYDFFKEKSDYYTYIPKWHSDFPTNELSKYSKEIEGICKYKDYYIPVYEIFDGNNDSEVLFIDISKLGKLIQYSPMDNERDHQNVIEYFTISVKEIIKGSKKESEILENAPDWLTEIGDKKAQSLYLQERVIIQIYERFDFMPGENVEGAIIRI